jgi:hypothetical protein
MDAGVAAIVGGALGIGATLLGSTLNARHNAALRERERKQDAYYGASRALLRVRNRRKRMLIRGYRQLDKDKELQPFLDDLVEAQHGLSVVLLVCGAKQETTLKTAIDEFDKLVDELILPPDDQEITLEEAFEKVEEARTTLRTAQVDDLEARR